MTFPTIDFKIELIRRSITHRQIAAAFGVHRTLVSQAINNLRNTPIQSRLLRMLGDMQAGKFTRLENY